MFAKITISGEFDHQKSTNHVTLMRALGFLCPAMTAGDKAYIIEQLTKYKNDVILCLIVEDGEKKKKQKIFSTGNAEINRFREEVKKLNLGVHVQNGD